MALRSDVIPQGRELDGNGLIVTAERMPAVLGPAVAGSALALAGFGWLFVAGSAAAALACLPLVGLKRAAVAARPAAADTAERTDRRPGSWPQTIVRRLFIDNARSLSTMVGLDRMLVGLTVTAFTYVFALGVGRIFLSEYSVQRFAHLHGALGYFMAATAAGGAVGGIVTPWLKKAPPGLVYLGGNVLEGCCWLALAAVHTLPAAVALLALAGLFESSATVIFFAEVQTRLPDSFTGRYYAMLLPVCDAFQLAGSVTGGLVILAGVNWAALIICAAMIVPTLAYTIPFTRPPVPHLIATGRTPAAGEGAG